MLPLYVFTPDAMLLMAPPLLSAGAADRHPSAGAE